MNTTEELRQEFLEQASLVTIEEATRILGNSKEQTIILIKEGQLTAYQVSRGLNGIRLLADDVTKLRRKAIRQSIND